MSYNHVGIRVHDDPHTAPRYKADDTQLELEEVVITEKATESGLPLVDLVLRDKGGHLHYAMVTGRILNAVSAAIKGCNLRNHGKEEP